MQAIRNMEPAWEKTAGLKFQLGSYEDANGQMRPCYSLTKTECLYIATKFNDEARARLVMRWQELEMDQREALEWERWKARWSQIERPKGAIALLGCSEEDILDEARDLNSFLCDQGIIQWAKGQWMPTRKFMNQGLTENRSFVIHGRNGHRRTVSRLVWTAKGRDFIMNIIKH